MTDLFRRFRGLGIAFVVLALSAGAAFAAAPRFHPVSNEHTTTVETTETTTESTTETTTSGDDDDVDAGDTTTTETSTDDGDAEDGDGNHGELVSTAAQGPLDPRFETRGAWVSCVAKLGKDVTVDTVDWAQVTEDCVADQEAKEAAKQARKDAAKTKSEAGKSHAKTKPEKTKTHGKPRG